MPWMNLIIAIIAEVIGTSALRASDGFSRPIPSMIVVAGYGIAFYFLSLTLKSIPVGIAYAVWSGVGTVLITLVGVVVYKQQLDLPAVIGLCCILAGVAVINLYSKSIIH
ncbi:MAG: DMT family transporter [Candidatus Kapaibacterium sp.]